MKRKIGLLLCSVLSLCALVGCNNSSTSGGDSSQSDFIEVVDLASRTVTVKKDIDRVLCIGSGSLRLYSYVADMDKLCGVETIEKSDAPMKLPKRPYQVLYQEKFDALPACGLGGPKGQIFDNEKILACNPDVVFTTIKTVKDVEDFSSKTNIPALILNYGQKGGFETDDSKNGVKKSLEIIGKVMNTESRVNTLTKYMTDTAKELDEKTKNIPENEKPSVYLGALGNYGMHGLNSSQPHYPLLESINTPSVIDHLGPESAIPNNEQELDAEVLSTLNPSIVFIDAGGLDKTKQQLANKDEPYGDIYRSWDAFKNDNVYVFLPYKVYYMQIENGLIDAIFAAKTLYPAVFSDLNMEEKVREVYTTFYGVDCYDSYLEAANLKGVALNKFIYE